MTFTLKDVLKLIPKATAGDLKKLLDATSKELDFRKLKDYVEYVPDIIDDDLRDGVMRECESLNLPESVRKASSQWLSSTNEPYFFNDTDPIHHALDIFGLPFINKVKDIFNSKFNLNLDACLVLKYCSSSTSTSLHDDSEGALDQTQPICNLTVGDSRVIEFVAKGSHRPVCKITMKNRGVVIMWQGCQQELKHMVRGDSKKKKELRYSLSYRTLAKKSSIAPSSQVVTPSATSTPNTELPGAVSPVAVPKRHVCLIAGDSYAARLDTQKLGRNSVVVESVARGGAVMHHVMAQLKEYASSHKDTVVDKICISVGTNDIRYCNGVGHLRLKLKSLCFLIKDLFPSSKVYFQLLIPLPCLHSNDWNTNTKVMDFNRIIINECIFQKFCVMDAFAPFCAPRRDFWTPELRDYRFFKGNDIHPSVAKGMGVLAKLYIRAIHSKFFNPFVFQ